MIYPLVIFFVWSAVTLLYRGYMLHRAGKSTPPDPSEVSPSMNTALAMGQGRFTSRNAGTSPP